jgi:glycosyltransferase involved in cell wall biosynthesis
MSPRSEHPSFLEQDAWPRRIGIINDYLRIPYANGSSFASQFLYRELGHRGHDVTVIGPEDPAAKPGELPRYHIALPALPLRNHPGVQLPLPGPKQLQNVVDHNFDVLLAQCSSALVDLGPWLRARHNVPYLCVNTVNLPSVYNVVLPDVLNQSKLVNAVFAEHLIPRVERLFVHNYNQSDGLIVLSEAFESYWRKRGVTSPIHVIPRAVEPKIFDVPTAEDPFPARAKRGARLLCVCRHTREKGIERLIDIFARWIAPQVPEATLTLVGDGPDHDAFKAKAIEAGVGDRVFFPGEHSVTSIPAFYRHADLFVYTSLSETYGQVVSEALWCRLPVVALNDDMGVCGQVKDGVNGVLVNPGPDVEASNWRFGNEAVALLRNHSRRALVAERAERMAHDRSDPSRCVDRYYAAFQEARRHLRSSTGTGFGSRPQSKLVAGRYLARWTALNLAVAGFGFLRPPAVVNRHGRKQPTWEAFERPSRPSELRDLDTSKVTADSSVSSLESPHSVGA